MIKTKVFAYIAILTLALSGCEKEESEQLTVYSFSGENERLAVSNGVIVLNGTEEIFSGGERDVILSISTVDMTGGMVNVSGDLGQISGDSIIRRIKIDDGNDLENVLHFELTTKNKNGEENYVWQ